MPQKTADSFADPPACPGGAPRRLSGAPAQAVWAALPLPALQIDASGRIDAANPAAEAFLNCSEKSLLGAAFTHRARCDPPLDAAFRRVAETRAPLTIRDLGIRLPGRDPVWRRAELSPLPEKAGGPGPLLLLLLPAGAERDEESAPAADSAQSAIGMAEMLVHEIRNPLAGISGAAQLLSMSLDARSRELTDMIVSETRRVSRLLDRVEQFGNPLSPDDRRPFNLHDVLDRARQSSLLGFAADVPIAEEYDPSLPEALGDPDQVLQVFLNLLKNAAEALRRVEGGAIRMRSQYDNGLRVRDARGRMRPAPLRVDIIDNGPGLPAGIADAVFAPFVSGRENGAGLGLALVGKIVADHGGRVGVKSRPGRTVFTVALPEAPR